MKKMFIITLVLVILIAALSGCANASVQPEPPVPEPTPAAEQITPSGPESTAKVADKGSDTQGRLNGWIDNNSVEIEINPEDILALRVTDVLDQLKGINDGDMVKFSYETNENGQLNIIKIEKVE
jgi:hypothetical protein